MAAWLFVHTVFLYDAWRTVKKRFQKNVFLSAWFVVLLFVFVGMVLWVVDIQNSMSSGGAGAEGGGAGGTRVSVLPVDPGPVLLLAFFITMAKTYATSIRRFLKNSSMVFLFSQPIRRADVLVGAVVSEVFFNLYITGVVLGAGVVELLVFNFNYYPNPIHLAQLYLAVVAGTFGGFALGVGMNTHPRWAKIGLIFSASAVTSFAYTALNDFPGSPQSIHLLAGGTVVGEVALLLANRCLVDTWSRATAAGGGVRMSFYERTTGKLATCLMRPMGWNTALLFEKEVVEKIRTREYAGSLIALGAVGAGVVYAMGRIPNISGLSPAVSAAIPGLVFGGGLYTAALLEQGLPALTSFGKEGAAMWFFKTTPVPPWDVVGSKVLASLYMVPAMCVLSAVLPGLYLGVSPMGVVFAVAGATSMAFYASSAGIIFGARMPNFDRTTKGYPDIITTYLFAIVVLFLVFITTTPPFLIYIEEPILGVLAMVFVADMGALFLYLATSLAAEEFEKMEPPV